jgi:hypothetical protein
VSTTALRGPLASTDFTTKADADVLGNGWVDGHAWDPDVYEPLGVRDGAVVCTDPMARDVVYDLENQEGIGDGSVEGNLLGIGCAWRPTIYDAPTVTMTWAGYNTPAAWCEASPLIHVVPGTPEHGMGVWCSAFLTSGFLIVGSISNPSHDIHERVYAVAGFAHTTGTPREIQIRSDGEAVTIWLDGSQVSMSNGYGLNPIPVPAALLGSRLHGLAVDAHLTSDPEIIPTIPSIFDWSIE